MPRLYEQLDHRFGREVVFYVAHAFLQPEAPPTADELVEATNQKFHLSGGNAVKRTEVYDCVRAAVELRWVRFEPSVNADLSAKVADAYGLNRQDVYVVDVLAENSEFVSEQAAKV